MNSQYYLYDYEVLKQYISHFDKNAVLLIPISYFQITYLKSDFTDQKDRYNQFLVKEMGNDYSTQNKLLDYIPVLTANTNLTFIIRDISPASFLTESELLTYSEMKHESWSSMDENDNATTEEGFIHNKQMLSQIIDFCYANDIQPVLITTPITSILNTTYEENSTDFFDTFYRFSRELQEDYPSLLYLDYSHDPRFENEFTLFQDADHLNSVGAKNFTETVIHDLQSNGILTPIN
jgi:hypothetical protein